MLYHEHRRSEKNNELITAGFHLGLNILDAHLQADRIPVLQKNIYEEATGCEGFYVLDVDAAMAVQIEDFSAVGRLFDMDVLTPKGQKISWENLWLPGRTCLICRGPVHICRRSRAHSLEALQEKTRSLLQEAIWQQKAEQIGALATKSLLTEVCTTPKPGLADRHNNGSHKDMDIFTFMGSCVALQPYFTRCALTGMQTAQADACETFAQIRFWGKQAEQTMYTAIGGVNTHKGTIFTLGLLCAAAGRCESTDPTQICTQVAAMTAGITKLEFVGNEQTVGEKLYAVHGITGTRGQAEAGFPALTEVGLSKLEEGLSRGLTLGEDPFPCQETLEKLDVDFIEKNLAPGGSADLLAATYFLHFLKTSL